MSCDTQLNCRTSFHNSYCTLCHHPFSAFCLVVSSTSSAEISTLRRIHNPIQTKRIDIREDANTHKVIWCKLKFLHGCGLDFPDWLLPLSSFFSAHLVLVAQRVERLSVSVLHDHYSHAGNYIGLLSNTALLLSTDSKLLCTLSTPPKSLTILDHCSCLDSLASGVNIS